MELKKPISLRKPAFAALDPLLGVKNGKKSGMRLGIARISAGRNHASPENSASFGFLVDHFIKPLVIPPFLTETKSRGLGN